MRTVRTVRTVHILLSGARGDPIDKSHFCGSVNHCTALHYTVRHCTILYCTYSLYLDERRGSVWVWNSSLRQTGRRFESHRWCMEFVTKRGVIATRVAKGLLLHTVAPN